MQCQSLCIIIVTYFSFYCVLDIKSWINEHYWRKCQLKYGSGLTCKMYFTFFWTKLRKKSYRCKSSFITCHNKLQMTRVLSSSFSSPTQLKLHFTCKLFNNTLNINKQYFLLLIHSFPISLPTYSSSYHWLTNNQLVVISHTHSHTQSLQLHLCTCSL